MSDGCLCEPFLAWTKEQRLGVRPDISARGLPRANSEYGGALVFLPRPGTANFGTAAWRSRQLRLQRGPGLFTRAAAASWCSHTQPRRSVVCFWCCAKRDGWPENISFDFPGKFKNLYSCRLSAVCGAEYHWACMNVPGGLKSDPLLVASQTLGTSWSDLSQPRRPVVCSWCLAKRSGGPENNSFGFPGKFKTLLSGKLMAGCGAEHKSQQDRRQGASGVVSRGGILRILLGTVCPSSGIPGTGLLAQASQGT